MITVKQQIVYAKNGSSAMLECEVSATLNWVTFKSIFVQCNKKSKKGKTIGGKSFSLRFESVEKNYWKLTKSTDL